MCSAVRSVPDSVSRGSAVSLVPPRLPRPLIARPHLVGRLGPDASSRLSLITGSPGAGKTTLARSWAASADTPWAWVTVDTALSRSLPFWGTVSQAIQRTMPASPFDVHDMVQAEGVAGRQVLEQLTEDVLAHGDAEHPVVVVVDDAHLLEPSVWREVEWLVDHQPPALHLMIASRSDPPFSIARLRSVGAVAEVREHELVLSGDETAALLADSPIAGPTARLAETLHRRTEGWAAGVRLAMLAIERGADADKVLASRDASDGMISELLVAEVLDHQPAEIRTFLEATSVVSVLDPDLCRSLTGRTDSTEILARLADDHVFIAALDEEPLGRYRSHPLLAELLRLRLRSSRPEAEPILRLIAADWYEQHAMIPEAIEQALAGHHYQRAFELTVGNIAALHALGRRADIRRWLLELPDEFVAADVDRTLDHCEALLFLVRPEWLRWLRRTEALVGDGRPEQLARLHRLTAFTVAGQGDSNAFDQHICSAHELLGREFDDPFAEVVDAWRVRLHTLNGRHAEAVPLARSHFSGPRRLIADLPALGLLAATMTEAGHPDSHGLLDDFVATWRREGEPDYFGIAEGLCAASALAIERDDLDEAEQLANAAMEVTAAPPPNLLWTRAQVASARVEHAFGRTAEALDRLRSAREAIAATDGRPPMRALVDDAFATLVAGVDQTVATRPVEALTDRELTILHYLASHRTFPEIASELFISRHTVKTHVKRIYRKLDVGGRSAAVRAGEALGYLDAAR